MTLTAKETLDTISEKLADNFGYTYPHQMNVIFKMVEEEFKREFPGEFTLTWNVNIADLKWIPHMKFNCEQEKILWNMTNL